MIKKTLRIILALALVIMNVDSRVITIKANEEITNLIETQVIVKDSTTGEVVNTILKDELIEIHNTNTRSSNGDTYYELTYEATIPLTFTKQVNTRSAITTTNEIHDVKATLRVSYVLNGEYIKVTGVSGSWVGTSSSYSMIFNNKEVWLFDGVFMGKYLEKYPTVSDFSYTTNWGFVLKYPVSTEAGTGARAFSSTKATISGMGGGYIVETYAIVP